MKLPSRSKVFAVINLIIAVILMSINVISCVSATKSNEDNALRKRKSNHPFAYVITNSTDDWEQFSI